METALFVIAGNALRRGLTVSQVLEELLYEVDCGNRAPHVTPEMRTAFAVLFLGVTDPDEFKPRTRPAFYPPLGKEQPT